VNKSEIKDQLSDNKTYNNISNNTNTKKNTKNSSIELNDRYTFDTFIVGSNNSMAHAAALAVAESPFNNPLNPLFIYGGSGLGKTHLVHSIAHYIAEHTPELNVLYVTSEEYTNEIVNAMRNSKENMTLLNTIKKKYREVDILIVDDIQFIIGKTSTQEEFFHTFNTLYEQGKQIILTSDKHPNMMKNLDERYRTRFTSGVPVDITPPDYETRLSILMNKNDENDIKLNDDIIKFIAENIKTNIRDLEGAYNKIILRSKLQHCDITINVAMEDLKDLILTDDNVKITNDYIINIVIEHYGISLEEITSKNRSQKIADVRMICMYLCRKITNSSESEIARKFNRDRSTANVAIRKIEDRLLTDTSLQNDINILMTIINHQE
jgi:chromosomal replication initiator protein